MKNTTSMVKSAFKEAAKQTQKMVGKDTDRELRLYDSLTIDDFDALRKKGGLGGLADYVHQMTNRRMGVK